jgi:hypothetical protein
VANNVIKKMLWTTSKNGVPQLVYYPGNHLIAPNDREQTFLGFMEEEFTGAIKVKELRNLKPPEWGIVADFYKLWADNTTHRPTAKELQQARELIDAHGQTKAKALIPLVVNRLKQQWPEAKAFGATSKYLAEVASEYDQQQRRTEQQRQARVRLQQERQEAEQQRQTEAQFKATWQPVWDALSESERDDIRVTVTRDNPILARRPTSSIVHSLCLQELARRHEAGQGSTTPADQPS